MSDVKLKPCPFCGRTPKSRENRAGGLHIFCSHEPCGQSEVEGDYQEAIAAWNTRALDPIAEQMAKALQRSAVLLRAVSAFITENPIADYEVFYDEAECDDMCLRDDCDIATVEADDALAAYRASAEKERAQ